MWAADLSSEVIQASNLIEMYSKQEATSNYCFLSNLGSRALFIIHCTGQMIFCNCLAVHFKHFM